MGAGLVAGRLGVGVGELVDPGEVDAVPRRRCADRRLGDHGVAPDTLGAVLADLGVLAAGGTHHAVRRAHVDGALLLAVEVAPALAAGHADVGVELRGLGLAVAAAVRGRGADAERERARDERAADERGGSDLGEGDVHDSCPFVGVGWLSNVWGVQLHR